VETPRLRRHEQGRVTVKIYKPLADGIYWDDMNRRVFPADPFDWTGKYLEAVEKVEAIEKSGQPALRIIRRLEDVNQVKQEGKIGVILGNEGSLPLGERLEHFDPLYRRGLRELAPYWPAGNHTSHILDQKGSLTPLARQLIEKANVFGVVLDSSHLAGTPAFHQLLELTKTPIIHTHGAARFPRSRGLVEGDLEDDQIRAIANRGGVIGLHFCTYIKNLNGWYGLPRSMILSTMFNTLLRWVG
jgi:membrane dipeptidase